LPVGIHLSAHTSKEKYVRKIVFATLLCLTASIDAAHATRPANPTNLYVSTTGSDSNSCLTAASPCLTIQHAANLATTYDFAGQNLTINLAAGTYTQGLILSGPFVGATTGTGTPASLIILGAGSATTVIDNSTTCLPTVFPIIVHGDVNISLGSVQVTTSCNGAADVYLERSHMSVVNGDVVFGAAPFAHIDAYDHSTFDPNPYPITLSGGGLYMFVVSTHSTIIISAGATNTILGTPSVSGAFVDEEDHGMFLVGAGAHWSGSVIGTRYAIALNSTIDTEQNAAPLPGSLPGTVSNGSHYYVNTGQACIGGSGCRNTTSPTGLGSGGSATIATYSSDHSGAVSLVAGTGASSSGTLTIAPGSLLRGDTGQQGYCVVSLSNAGSQWAAAASTQSYYDIFSDTIRVLWFNGGANLVSGNSYNLSYVCD
jgi:hypothetical protein